MELVFSLTAYGSSKRTHEVILSSRLDINSTVLFLKGGKRYIVKKEQAHTLSLLLKINLLTKIHSVRMNA